MHFYEHLVLYRLLAPLASGPGLANFVEEELGPLLASSEQQPADLLNTLDAYLQANGNGTILGLLENFHDPFTPVNLRLRLSVEIRSELCEGGEFPKLCQVAFHLSGNLLHGFHLRRRTHTRHRETDRDSRTDTLVEQVRFQEDLVDQLFNSSEKRLARVLLLLARFGKEGVPEPVIPKISQEILAEMIGTTRSRVSFFLNRFRKLGFIHYNGGLAVHSSLLNVVLHD